MKIGLISYKMPRSEDIYILTANLNYVEFVMFYITGFIDLSTSEYYQKR